MSTLRAMIHVRQLQPGDAPAIAAIASRCHRVRADGEARHRRRLADASRAGVNLSFGVFDHDRLVGYLLCYGFSPTIFPGEIGEALYVEDAAVLPRCRRLLPRVIRRFGVEARRRFPGSAIEAHAVESVLSVWRDHPSFFAGGGYAITRHADSGEMLKGEIRHLVRWQPIPDWGPPVPTAEQLVARLHGQGVEGDGVPYMAKVVKAERDWEALAAVWDRLVLATPDHTVFQAHEYQRRWWRHFGGDSELFIVLLVRDGEVRGIAPFQIEVLKQYGRWVRRLAFIGSHRVPNGPRLLFPAAEERSLCRALVACLVSGHRWDVCDLHGPASSALATLESAFRASGCLVGRSWDRTRPPRAGTWSELHAECRVVDTVPEIFDQLEIHWDIEARNGGAADGRHVDFHRELAERFGKQRAFVVRTHSVGGRPVASALGLAHDGVFYSLRSALDPAFSSSPATCLEAGEPPWTSTSGPAARLQAYRRTPFFLALHTALFRVKPRITTLVKRPSR